jgi:hypothetical protein
VSYAIREIIKLRCGSKYCVSGYLLQIDFRFVPRLASFRRLRLLNYSLKECRMFCEEFSATTRSFSSIFCYNKLSHPTNFQNSTRFKLQSSATLQRTLTVHDRKGKPEERKFKETDFFEFSLSYSISLSLALKPSRLI